jgi:enoyl-CoA hydratase
VVTYEVQDGIAEIRIDDGKVNAMSAAFFDELNAALDRVEADRPRAAVLVGRERYFSAGLDVKLLPTLTAEELTRTLRAFGHTLLRVFAAPLPTVAAMTGHAIAGGLFLGFACDLRILARGAYRLQANEHAIGLPLPTWALAITESVVVGPAFVEMMLHARPYTPEEALAGGFVTALADPNDVVAAARERAAALAGLDPRAYATSKRRVRERALAWAGPKIPAEMVGFSGSR